MPSANILGELTAEADSAMLANAFYPSRNYRELTQGTSFSFVVGRRGTGKSALFSKVAEALGKDNRNIILLREKPDEAVVRACHAELSKLSKEYSSNRAITKLMWKAQLLMSSMEAVANHYKGKHASNGDEIAGYRQDFKQFFHKHGVARGLDALRAVLRAHPDEHSDLVPEYFADFLQLSRLQSVVHAALDDTKLKIVYLYDGLDEGWTPNQVSTSLLGGLARLAADFREGHSLHCILFIRDNMFRALAELDDDFTRNIEGNTLRLHWDEEALLELVTLRLRTALSLGVENKIKLWNRFAKNDLDGIAGFRRCLQLTLYRPRDVIALLNGAYQVASAKGRDAIVEQDVEATATQISQARLADLFKEYDQVLPGLKQFAEAFRGSQGKVSLGVATDLLEGVVHTPTTGLSQRDFSLLSSGSEALSALYSVGFVGIADPQGAVKFCHDGSNTPIDAVRRDTTIVVHPCYWRALDVIASEHAEVVIRVDDEDDISKSSDAKANVADLRLRRLGTVIAKLGNIPKNPDGAHQFEEWVLSAVQYLCAGGLENITLKPNPGLVQQRDIVGTLNEKGGSFWRRLGKYDVKQLVIEAKNFEEIGATEFRQAWGYLTGPYGKFMLIVSRSEKDVPSEHERALVKEGYDSDGRKLVMIVPAKMLILALRKMHKPGEARDDYINEKLSRRLDQYEREYVGQRSARVRRK